MLELTFFFIRNLGNNFFTYLPVRGIGSLRELNVTGVRTLLYLPPIELFHSLSSLVAFYPYHCCQLAKASRLSGKVSDARLLLLSLQLLLMFRFT